MLQRLAVRVDGYAPKGAGTSIRERELVGCAGCPSVGGVHPAGRSDVFSPGVGDGGYGGSGDFKISASASFFEEER